MSALFALAAAVGWGSSDFAAGYASRKSSATSVVILTHLASVIVLALFALDIGLGGVGIDGSPTTSDIGWGLAAGVAGGAGAMLLFRGLGKGSMAVVAPITATGAATIPVLFGLVTGDAVTLFGILGIVLALVAIVLVSLAGGDDAATDDASGAETTDADAPGDGAPDNPVSNIAASGVADDPLHVPADWSTQFGVNAPPSGALQSDVSTLAPPSAPRPVSTTNPAPTATPSRQREGAANGDVRMSLTTVRQAVLALVATAVLSAAAIASIPIRQLLDGGEFTGVVTVQLVFALVIVGLTAFALNKLKLLFDFSDIGVRRQATKPAPAASAVPSQSAAPTPAAPVSGRSWKAMISQPGVPEALFSGIGFGLFFVFIYRASEDAGHWPLVSARGISVVMFCLIAFASRSAILPERGSRRPVILAGVLDAGAAILFVLSTRTGLLSVGAVLAALYPVVTVLLARIITKERIRRQQMIGLGLALGAVALLAV